MKNFNYNIPTKVLFGRGKVNEVGKEAKRYGDKVLLVYGKGSVKKSGLFDVVVESLKKSGRRRRWRCCGTMSCCMRPSATTA